MLQRSLEVLCDPTNNWTPTPFAALARRERRLSLSADLHSLVSDMPCRGERVG